MTNPNTRNPDGPGHRATEVHKFGGTSVGTPERIERAAGLAIDASKRSSVCVVSSAMSGITNLLVEVTKSNAHPSRLDEAIHAIHTKHNDALAALDLPRGDTALERVPQLLDELSTLSHAVRILHVTPARIADRLTSMGERLAVQILAAAIRRRGADAVAVDADTMLETDASFGESEPLSYAHDHRAAAALNTLLGAGTIPVVTGFIGRGPDGDARLLGRGGSDLSASLLAAALDAQEIVIWTDVAGVYTADPRLVPDAEAIHHLHYREAGEMAFFGSKVLHPRTIIPAVAKSIPVSVRSTLDPDGSRTSIDGSFGGSSTRQVSISTLRDIALISVEGGGMAGLAGISARLFAALTRVSVSAVMISQGSSESSICVAVQGGDADTAESALRDEFRLDISRGAIEEVNARSGVSIVTAVGVGMKHRVGAASLMTTALARAGVNILAIAQGSSELSVSFAVDADLVRPATRTLHESLRASKTNSAGTPRLSIAIVGFGGVGRALAEALQQRTRHRVVAVADSSALLHHDDAIPADRLNQAIAHKASGDPLRSLNGSRTDEQPLAALLSSLRDAAHPNPVIVDCTATPDTVRHLGAALSQRIDVVTANKEVLACPQDRYDELTTAARSANTMLLGEATVGAAIPLARTIDNLRRAGDRIVRIEAVLSGTVGYLVSQLASSDADFEEILQQAVALGFAEPDPRADLLGVDLERKALILNRIAGLHGPEDADTEPFIDTRGAEPDDPSWTHTINTAGESRRAQIREAMTNGLATRYVASVASDAPPRVHLATVDSASPFANLAAGESRAVITTEVHRDIPIVVSGAGAGHAVTAAAIMSDLATISERRFSPTD